MSEPIVQLVQETPRAVRVLHLGCGRQGKTVPLVTEAIAHVTTLDADEWHEPDLVCELGVDKIDLPDDAIDSAMAVHVLEHIGMQGVTAEWFFFWEELYRVLAPNGALASESHVATER